MKYKLRDGGSQGKTTDRRKKLLWENNAVWAESKSTRIMSPSMGKHARGTLPAEGLFRNSEHLTALSPMRSVSSMLPAQQGTNDLQGSTVLKDLTVIYL